MEYAFLAISLFSMFIQGFEIHVDKDASCGNSCDGSESAPFVTIQEGLDAGGSILTINDGTYTGEGNVNLSMANSYSTIRSKNGPESTILDCENEGSSFGIDLFSGTFTVSGLSIKNCNAIKRVWDYNGKNYSGTWGGGLFILSTFTQIYNCIIDGNEAEYGGGIGIFSNTVNIYDSILKNNRARARGGAIYEAKAHIKLDNVTIRDNEAEDFGGGVFVRDASLGMWYGSQIFDNDADKGDNAAV